MTSVKIRLNKNRDVYGGKYPLVVQILHKRKKKIVKTGYYMGINDFNSLKEKVIAKGESEFSLHEARLINHRLTLIKKEYQNKINKLELQWGDYDIDEIIHNSRRGHNQYLLKSFDACIQILMSQNRVGMAIAYKSTKSSLAKFLREVDIDVASINEKFVNDYESYMIMQNVSRNTISFYMRNLRSLFNHVKAEGYHVIIENPFMSFNMSPKATSKRALKRKDLIKLANFKFYDEQSHLEFARDMFMFSFYTRVMSFVDISYLTYSDIKSNILYYCRRKSRQNLQIEVLPRLRELMKKYKTDSIYILPILDDKSNLPLRLQYKIVLNRVNRNLKTIGSMLNITGNLTTYVARHSWATIAKEMGTPISVISEGLGHSSEKITSVYLKQLDSETIDRINAKIANLL